MAIDITPYTHVVALTLASSGLVVDVWDEYAVVLDMLAAGNPWSFAFWRSDPVNGQTTGDRSTSCTATSHRRTCCSRTRAW